MAENPAHLIRPRELAGPGQDHTVPRLIWKSACLKAAKIYRTQERNKPCLKGHGPYIFANVCCQLCCGVGTNARTALESGCGGSGHSEGKKGSSQDAGPCLVGGT
ncbi:hypothetical protein GHT09_000046 [Marmota monax]|uniref:Uncharacterized protein n=1 Tax=Marmota monax TaxID=9995 RepID=A0A834VA17_MARMO|nr:hypothetical protein GHT09_000046 [Marmota monax]